MGRAMLFVRAEAVKPPRVRAQSRGSMPQPPLPALGLIEVTGLAPALVALDVLDKAADVRLVQVELNDQLGALIKITGSASAVRAAVGAAEAAARQMRVGVVTDVINAPDERAWPAVESKPEFNALMEAEVVYIPGRARRAGGSRTGTGRATE